MCPTILWEHNRNIIILFKFDNNTEIAQKENVLNCHKPRTVIFNASIHKRESHHMAQLIGSFHISSQWACCLTFKYLASGCYSNCSTLQKPSTFPSSTCLNLLWGDSCMLHMELISYMLYVQQQYFLHAHSSMLWMYIGTCSDTAAAE